METLDTVRAVRPRRSRFRAVLVSLAFAAAAAVLPSIASAGIAVDVSVGIAPPPLPVYVQSPIPAPGYIWVPGYWAWDGNGYYWVPGTWVQPPYVGALWTPGYWGWAGGVYVFHRGYWGPHVGFYGGINYGFGYTGVGYAGGYWRGGAFYYNRSVNRIDNVHITNVYNRTVVNNTTINRTSFNGGQDGVVAHPTSQEARFASERHTAPVAAQEQQRSMASQNQAMRASFNHGTPAFAATPRAGQFKGGESAAARVNAHPAHAAVTNGQRASGAAYAPHDNMAMRSASFAPHAAPNAAGETRTNHYSPSTSRATYTRGPANAAGGFHAASRPQPSYASRVGAPAYRSSSPALHSAGAMHPQGHASAAPHREGGERH